MTRAHVFNDEFGKLVASERRITRQIVELIAECEQNYYYAELGYDSIMRWLMEGHLYTKSAAYRRMAAAKLVTAVPAAKAKIESGELNLSTLCSLQSAIRQEEMRTKTKISTEQKAELVQMIETKSCEKVDRLIAVQFPDLELQKTESIKPIGWTETKFTLIFSDEETKELNRLKEVTSHSHFNASWSELVMVAVRDSLKKRDPLLKKARPRKEARKEAQKVEREGTDRKILLSQPWTAARKALSRMDAQRETEIGRTSKGPRVDTEQKTSSAPEPSYDIREISTFVSINLSSAPEPNFDCDDGRRLSSAPEPSLEKARRTTSAPVPLSPAVKREVLQRDRGRCAFVDHRTGKRCETSKNLEVDHITPRALGGSNDIGNLRTLCRTHNIMMSRRHFGVWSGSNHLALNC